MEKSKKILKGKDKEIDSNVVTKRASIDNNTLTEINEKYPTVTVKGVAYDLGLTYITLEKDYLDEPSVRKIIKDYGAEIIAVICFFRMKMCKPYGWYCSVDDDSLDTLIEDCAYTLKLGEERVRELYSALVERGIFYVISDDTGKYLADTQQLYNFEILNNNRMRDRIRKAKQRAQQKSEKLQNSVAKQEESAPTSPLKEVPIVEAESVTFLNSQNSEDVFAW